MVSQSQFAANRLNALHSTGPVTAPGKQRSSQNARTHGLFCKDLVLPGEDPDQLKSIHRSMLERFRPQDAIELNLVERIVQAHWKLRRCEQGERCAYLRYLSDRKKQLREELAAIEVEHRLDTPRPKPMHDNVAQRVAELRHELQTEPNAGE